MRYLLLYLQFVMIFSPRLHNHLMYSVTDASDQNTVGVLDSYIVVLVIFLERTYQIQCRTKVFLNLLRLNG